MVHQLTFSQTLDRDLYLSLLKTNSTQFIQYSKEKGYEITETPNVIFARSKDFRFEKPLLPIITIGWSTLLIVSSKNKDNNRIMYQKAKRSRRHKDSLTDLKYLYIESEIQNQATNEIWYTLKILRRRG
jgi:hypothetical protein